MHIYSCWNKLHILFSRLLGFQHLERGNLDIQLDIRILLFRQQCSNRTEGNDQPFIASYIDFRHHFHLAEQQVVNAC
jgi:hypothetical protein